MSKKKNTIEDLFDDDEDFSYYEPWLDDIDCIDSIGFNLGKELCFNKICLYGEYTHPIIHGRDDKIVRIATQVEQTEHAFEDWCKLEKAFIEAGYSVVFVDYDYLMASKVDKSANYELTMFRFGNRILYTIELKSIDDLRFVGFNHDLPSEEIRKICGI